MIYLDAGIIMRLVEGTAKVRLPIEARLRGNSRRRANSGHIAAEQIRVQVQAATRKARG